MDYERIDAASASRPPRGRSRGGAGLAHDPCDTVQMAGPDLIDWNVDEGDWAEGDAGAQGGPRA